MNELSNLERWAQSWKTRKKHYTLEEPQKTQGETRMILASANDQKRPSAKQTLKPGEVSPFAKLKEEMTSEEMLEELWDLVKTPKKIIHTDEKGREYLIKYDPSTNRSVTLSVNKSTREQVTSGSIFAYRPTGLPEGQELYFLIYSVNETEDMAIVYPFSPMDIAANEKEFFTGIDLYEGMGILAYWNRLTVPMKNILRCEQVDLDAYFLVNEVRSLNAYYRNPSENELAEELAHRIGSPIATLDDERWDYLDHIQELFTKLETN